MMILLSQRPLEIKEFGSFESWTSVTFLNRLEVNNVNHHELLVK